MTVMSHLHMEASMKACAFVMHLTDPLETLRKLSLFFSDRKIIIENLNMHRFNNGDAMLIVHCQIERDRISRTSQQLEKLPGIISLEKLEGK